MDFPPNLARSRFGALVVAVAVPVLALALPASAQVDPGPTTTTTTPEATTTTTVVGPVETTTTSTPEETTTTTLAVGDTIPPPSTTIPADPLAGSTDGLSEGGYAGQPAFELGSMAVMPALVKAATAALKAAHDRLTKAQAAVDAAQGDKDRLVGTISDTGAGRAEAVARAALSKENLRKRAVQAYIRGNRDVELMVIMGDPVEYSRANRYLEAVAGLDRQALADYRAGISRLSSAERKLVDSQANLEAALSNAIAERDNARQAVLDAQRCLFAFGLGSHTCANGFTFPVLGDVNFYDSWGAARLPGTAQAHWHEGTDIMAPMGREIVAVENGMLFKVGSAGLGGQRLWLHGESGTEYYYAHFSAFAAGTADGVFVTAGTVVGYVGNTGDAAGGPTHLHFEIHPLGARPVDPYPMLKAAWGQWPMPNELTALAGVPVVTAPPPPEEQ